MKKILTLATAAILIIFASCRPATKTAEATDDESRTVLVAYFSATGTTQAVAELLAQAAYADILPILPAEPYTEADLNWRDSLSRSSVEMRDFTSRPALAEQPKDLSHYQTVYIGFPIWWGVAPHIINSFIEAANLKGKTIIPFATSGGSEIAPATEALRKAYPELNILDGRLLQNTTTFDDLSEWNEELTE